MKTKRPEKTKICTEFAPETKFELRPAPLAPFHATRETEFERLKRQLLDRKLELAEDAETCARLRRAANEAAALACSTCVPLLVFPVLFEEKTAGLAFHAERQKRIYANNPEPFAA